MPENRPSPIARYHWLIAGLACLAGLLLSHALESPTGRMVCGAALLCFLPGAAAALLQRNADRTEIAILGLALSPLVLTLLVYVPGQLLRLPLAWCLAAAGLAIIAALSVAARRSPAAGRGAFDRAALIAPALGLLPLLVTIAYYVQQPEAMLNIHGLEHTAGINQIAAGLIPPDNTHLYGHPPAYQWPAHIAPAVASLAMGVSPPLAAAIQRLLTFAGLFGLAWLLARDLGQKPAARIYSALLAVLGMNLLGSLHYLQELAFSPEIRQALFSGAYHPEIQQLLTPGWFADHLRPRTASLAVKLINISFILPGYAAVMTAVLGTARVLRGRRASGFALLFLGTLCALLIHPVLAVIPALPLPLAFFAATWAEPGRKRLAGILAVPACLALAALPALPYLLPAMQSFGGEGVAARLWGSIIPATTWLYLPLLAAAAIPTWKAVRRRDPLGVFTAALAGAIILLLLMGRVTCEWYHAYLLAIPLGLLAGDLLGHLHARPGRRLLRPALALVTGLLVLAGPLLFIHAQSRVKRPNADRYRFAVSRLLELRETESDLARAYQWVRNNTAQRAVLMERPARRNDEELAAVSGRRVYVGEPSNHSPRARAGDDPMGRALRLAERLLTPGADKAPALEHLAALPDPAYLFLDFGRDRETLERLAAEYDALPELVRCELDLETVKVYRVLRGGPVSPPP